MHVLFLATMRSYLVIHGTAYYSAAVSVPACTGMFCGASGSYLRIRRQKSGNSTYRLLIVSHSIENSRTVCEIFDF